MTTRLYDISSLVSTREAAEILGTSLAGVYRLIEAGRLHEVQTPLGFLFERDQVIAAARERLRMLETRKLHSRSRMPRIPEDAEPVAVS